MLQCGIQALKENPVFGHGPKQRKKLQPCYDRLAKETNHRFHHPAAVGVHNIYLQNWLDFGLIGFAGYLAWGVILLTQMGKSLWSQMIDSYRNGILLGCLAGLSGIMVAGFFENNFRDGEVQTAVLVGMGIALAMLDQENRAVSK